VRRFLDRWRPDAVGFVESELWPNILTACGARHPTCYPGPTVGPEPRPLATCAGLARRVLGEFARVRARSGTDAARLREVGCGAVTPRN
jgi:3-deoxy-D-manno-octulosonic-acid transferase